MVDGVKSCSEVKNDENAEVTRVSGKEEVLGDFEEGCFCAVSGREVQRGAKRVERKISSNGRALTLRVRGSRNDTLVPWQTLPKQQLSQLEAEATMEVP